MQLSFAIFPLLRFTSDPRMMGEFANKPLTRLVGYAVCTLDLIAMSTHGHRFFADLILGSTASKVRHKAAIPVLLLKAPPDATGSRP